MVIEINKDIDRYKESVVMGLTAKQLIFSVASVVAGGSIVLLLYRYIGLTPSVYVAIPVVAPIALGGFYSFNGMSFYEVNHACKLRVCCPVKAGKYGQLQNGRGYWCIRSTAPLRNQYPEWYGTDEMRKCGNSF